MRDLEPDLGPRRHVLWVFAGAFAILVTGAFFGVPNKPMAGAQRILDGEVIYRDFWTIYAPGSYYAIAGLLKVFGRSVLVQAVGGVALRALAVALFFALVRRLGAGLRMGLALAGVLAVGLWEVAPELGTYPGILPAVLAAWLGAVAYAQGAPARRLFYGGLALGAGATFKHDVAAYAALSVCAALALAWWWRRAGEDEPRPASWVHPARAIAIFAAGCALIPIPVIAWLATAAGQDAWQDLIVFPAGDFRLVRSEPYPGLLPPLQFLQAWFAEPGDLRAARDAGDHTARWILANAPQWAFVGGLFVLLRRGRSMAPGRLVGMSIALVALPFYFGAAHVQQNTHLTSMAVCSFLFGTVAWREAGRGLRAFALALFLAWIPGLWVRPAMEAMLPLRVWSGWSRLDLPVARGVFVSPREAAIYETLNAFVEANVPPGEAIHVGVVRNDAVVVSDTRVYYMVDRPAATRYQELHPGITDVDRVQVEMIGDLETKDVRCLVLWHWGGRGHDAVLDQIKARRATTGIEGIGSTRFDEYVAAHYRPVLDVDEYTVYWRRDAGEPVLPATGTPASGEREQP